MYDRDYLKWAIPESSVDATDPQGLLEGDAREAWNDGYEDVLCVIRNEFLPGSVVFTEQEIAEAVFLANEAWNEYCGNQGDVDATIAWARNRMAA
jgi:hypothetical protein